MCLNHKKQNLDLCPWMFFYVFSAVIDCGEPAPLLNGGVTFLSGFQNQHRSVVQYHCNEPFYSLLGGVNGKTFTCSVLWCTDFYSLRSTCEAVV